MRTTHGVGRRGALGVGTWALGVVVVVALVAYGLKRHYADAPVDDLSWILAPTAWLVGAITGTPFTAVPREGYFSAERLFLIEKACAGINFMIAAFAMVAFALLHRVRSASEGAGVLAVSLVASYAAAVIVNTVRIVIAMWLADHPVTLSSLSAGEIHRLEGIIVYFGGLALLYDVVRRVDGGGFRSVALPLACYYGITLAVPFLNGAAGGSFFEHALVVLVLPPLLLLIVFGTQRLPGYLRRSVSAGSSPHARRAGNHAAAAAASVSAPAPTT